MAEFREDTLIYPIMVGMSACLCTELENSGLPEPCFCGLVPGQDAVTDCSCGNGGKCGSAWVRLIEAFPSTNFPDPDIDQATCSSLLVFRLEVGIARCVEVMDERGNAPTMAEQLSAVRTQMADMAAMRRAIQCCMADLDTEYVLGTYQPTSLLGGCGGGTWDVLIRQAF